MTLRQFRLLPGVATFAFGLALIGCSSLPSSGPSADVVIEPSGQAAGTRLIELDLASARAAFDRRRSVIGASFPRLAKRNPILLGRGDVLDVRVMEAGDNGLFANSQTRGTQFTAQIDQAGDLFTPYGGSMKAADRSPEQVRETLQRSLADKAIQPQVLLSVTASRGNSVTVLGDVGRPGLFPLSPAGTRLIDAIAAAGGARSASFDTALTIKRKDAVATLYLDDLLAERDNNILLAANDEILVASAPRSYAILGAVTTSGDVKFGAATVTLAEALARAGGLDSLAADAGGVFVFSSEPPTPDAASGERPVPVLYRLDFSSPQAFFIARQMHLRDKDVVYVASAPAVELARVLDLVGRVTAVARGGVGLTGDLQKPR